MQWGLDTGVRALGDAHRAWEDGIVSGGQVEWILVLFGMIHDSQFITYFQQIRMNFKSSNFPENLAFFKIRPGNFSQK